MLVKAAFLDGVCLSSTLVKWGGVSHQKKKREGFMAVAKSTSCAGREIAGKSSIAQQGDSLSVVNFTFISWALLACDHQGHKTEHLSNCVISKGR